MSEKVIVVGAGLMGSGIAQVFALGGFETVLVDMSDDILARAKSSIVDSIDVGVRLGKATSESAAEAKRLLTTSTALAASAEGGALLVETVSERLTLKQDVIREIDAKLLPDAIIATNTSALSVTEIATAAADPGRVVGMHFFNPVPKMKLVEIVLGLATRKDVVERTKGYCDAIHKQSIVVNEAPGLTTSRMSVLLGNEAMQMLAEGTASAEDIDTALRLGFNHSMGPLETGDLTGWDTRLSVLRYLHQTLGDRFRPHPLIIKMVSAGRFGRKSGRGIYQYENGQRVPGSGMRGSEL